MKSKENWFSAIDIRTVIYFAVLAFFFVPMAMTHTLNYNRVLLIIMLATAVYIVATKRWYYIEIAASLFVVSFAIQFMSAMYVQIKYQAANFIVSSFVLGFVFTLFLSTFSRHAEWTIHSPWIGNIYGAIAGMVVEYIMIMSNNERNVYLVGIPGLLAMLVFGIGYLCIGSKVRVHAPEFDKDADIDTLTKSTDDYAYTFKRNKKNELFLYDDTDPSASYRVFITKDKIAHIEANKEWKEWVKVHDKKSQYIYAWLLQQSVRSFEVRGPKPIKSEKFMIISVGGATKDPILIDVPLPRSEHTRKLAFISVSNNDFNKIGSQIEKATTLLKVNK